MWRSERRGKIVYEDRNRGCSLGCFLPGVVLLGVAVSQGREANCVPGLFAVLALGGAYYLIFTREGVLLDPDEQVLVVRKQRPWKTVSETLPYGQVRKVVSLYGLDSDGDKSWKGVFLETGDGRLVKVHGSRDEQLARQLAADLHVEAEERRGEA